MPNSNKTHFGTGMLAALAATPDSLLMGVLRVSLDVTAAAGVLVTGFLGFKLS